MTDDKLLRRCRTLAALFAGLIVLTGCSSVPDAINPVEWYHGVEGWFESDEDQQTRTQAKSAEEKLPALPGAERPYPNLSTVPERPRSVSTPEERGRITQGLAADRDNARYAEPEPDRPSGAALGAPAAAPRTPVTRQPAPPQPGPSPDGMEPLPIEPQSTAPGPRSSVEDPAPAVTPVAAEAPTAEKATVQPAVVRQSASAPAAPAPRAQPVQQAQATSNPAPASKDASLVEQTYNAALAEYDRAVAVGSATGGPKTAAGTPIPGSFVVHFASNSAEISGADRALLRDVAELYKSTGGTLRIVGHASHSARTKDEVRQRITNFRISSQRAEAVARELARLGVPREAMAVSAVSDSEPIYDESQPKGAAGNRRVEIFFTP